MVRYFFLALLLDFYTQGHYASSSDEPVPRMGIATGICIKEILEGHSCTFELDL